MIEIVPADIYNPARCDCCGAAGTWMVGMDTFYLCRRCIADAANAVAEHKEKEGQSIAITKPPKGWRDIGERFFYRELKTGPEYLCRYCGAINDTRSPRHHNPGCPYSKQAKP